jgi:hypothetical protein
VGTVAKLNRGVSPWNLAPQAPLRPVQSACALYPRVLRSMRDELAKSHRRHRGPFLVINT